jgi:hypothetical protein
MCLLIGLVKLQQGAEDDVRHMHIYSLVVHCLNQVAGLILKNKYKFNTEHLLNKMDISPPIAEDVSWYGRRFNQLAGHGSGAPKIKVISI